MNLFERMQEAAAGFDRTEPLGVGKQSRRQIGWIAMPMNRNTSDDEQIDPDRFEEDRRNIPDEDKQHAKRVGQLNKHLAPLPRALELAMRSIRHSATPVSAGVTYGHAGKALGDLIKIRKVLEKVIHDLDNIREDYK
jgi:hypothetical protein